MFKTFTNPVEHVARKQFSAKERAEHFAKAEGKCANCKRKIRPGESWDLEGQYPFPPRGS